jgi:hypothetical protein
MADANLPGDGTSDDLDAVLDRFTDFEKELLTLPRFDDRPATEQDRLRQEYREHLEKLDTARRAGADPVAAAVEKQRILVGFRELLEAAGPGDPAAWDLLVRISQVLARWARDHAFWEDMRKNLRPPKPKVMARILPDVEELGSGALYGDSEARDLLDEVRQLLVRHLDAMPFGPRPAPGASR